MNGKRLTASSRLVCLFAITIIISCEDFFGRSIEGSWERTMIGFASYSWAAIALGSGVPGLQLKAIAALLSMIAVGLGGWRWLNSGTFAWESPLTKMLAVLLTLSLLKAIRWSRWLNRS